MKLKKKTKKKLGSKVCAVDLFCGAGGLTKGLERSGINVRLGIDIDDSCQYPYTANNNATFLLKSVQDIEATDLETVLSSGDIRLLAGCAPCQTFSSYNQKAENAETDDQRWWLLLEFSRLVKELLPELVTMENVPGLQDYEIFDEFVSDLKENGYQVSYQVVNCVDYGMAQHRRRLVLLASRLGPIQLVPPNNKTKAKTVRQAIGNLKSIKAGEACKRDALHKSSSLSDLNTKRIKVSKPGGTWRDWPKELIADCHKKKTGKTYPGVYGRMKWDQPAPTMTTQFFGFGNGRFGHPEQDRAISLREGAILQSFPKNYAFTAPGEPISTKNLGRLIGNAVPVKLGEVIGKSILKHVLEYENTDKATKKKSRKA